MMIKYSQLVNLTYTNSTKFRILSNLVDRNKFNTHTYKQHLIKNAETVEETIYTDNPKGGSVPGYSVTVQNLKSGQWNDGTLKMDGLPGSAKVQVRPVTSVNSLFNFGQTYWGTPASKQKEIYLQAIANREKAHNLVYGGSAPNTDYSKFVPSIIIFYPDYLNNTIKPFVYYPGSAQGKALFLHTKKLKGSNLTGNPIPNAIINGTNIIGINGWTPPPRSYFSQNAVIFNPYAADLLARAHPLNPVPWSSRLGGSPDNENYWVNNPLSTLVGARYLTNPAELTRGMSTMKMVYGALNNNNLNADAQTVYQWFVSRGGKPISALLFGRAGITDPQIQKNIQLQLDRAIKDMITPMSGQLKNLDLNQQKLYWDAFAKTYLQVAQNKNQRNTMIS